MSYLANTIRTQIDLSNRLATAVLTMGAGDGMGGGQVNGASLKELYELYQLQSRLLYD